MVMETGHTLYRLIHQSPSSSSSSSSSSSLRPNLHHHFRRRLQTQNVRRPSNFLMPVRELVITLRRLTTSDYHFGFNRPTKPYCITNQFASISHRRMAEESKNVPEIVDPTTSLNASKGAEEKDKVLEKSTPSVPPLPEKPLPGDCCGSGCVRCVWDVYFEELEEYNRLYKADSNIS